MEDDKIREMLQGFQPELKSNRLFMARLQSRIDAVEIVKRHNERAHRRGRIAMAVAAVAGFVAGVLLTQLYPAISAWLSSINISLPSVGILSLALDGHTTSWLLIGAVSVTIALNAYELTLSRLALKEK